MPDVWNTPLLKEALKKICARMEAVSGELNELDGALGDGDLGVTMVRGCRAIAAEVDALPDDVGMALLACARAFTRTSGSTFGTLLATGLMSAAKATRGRTEVPFSEVAALLGGAQEAMALRGKAQLGDKTVLDAVEAVRQGVAAADGPGAMLEQARRATADCLDRLRGQPARQGRARIFGEKSVGRDDPGMVVFHHLVAALAG